MARLDGSRCGERVLHSLDESGCIARCGEEERVDKFGRKTQGSTIHELGWRTLQVFLKSSTETKKYYWKDMNPVCRVDKGHECRLKACGRYTVVE